jgi:S-DNA-T family DNA segregation ATPase FtsK/SpoIIIE
MAKKKLDKEAERTPSSPSKIVAVFKNETIHFVIGLMLVIFSVYLLLAFSSFFFTGAADQSIIDSGSSADLAAVNNQVKNYAGSRGAQLASYLINDCFGVSSFFILVFLAVAGLKLYVCGSGLSAAHSCWSGSPYSSDLPLWIIIRIPSFIWEVCTDIMSVVG